MGRQRVEVPVDLELNVNKEDFEKDITIAASKSGKKLEKELGASLEAAKQNIKEFAQLQKEVLSGGTVNKADYEYMRGLAEVSNELIRKYNNIQTAANRMTTTLTPGYKELQEAIELVNQDLKVMNDESYKTRKNIELIENIRGFKGHQAEIKELIALQQQYQAQLKANQASLDKLKAKNEKSPAIRLFQGHIDKEVAKISEIKERIKELREDDKFELDSMKAQLDARGLKATSEELTRQKAIFEEYGKSIRLARNEITMLTEEQSKLKEGKYMSRGVDAEQFSQLRTLATNMEQFDVATQGSARQLGHLNILGYTLLRILRKTFGTARSGRKTFSDFFDSLKKGFKHALKNIMRYGLGVRSLYFLFRRLRGATKEAFKVMAQVIPEVNKQVSSLVTNFNLIKANLGTMVQPLLQFVVPAFAKLAQYAQIAMEFVGKLFATITGQNYIYKASAAWVDYADSVSEAGKALKNTLGIDELNILDDNNDSKNLFSPGTISYEKSEITEGFFKDLKEAWENADFTEIGKVIAEKFKNMFLTLGDKLPGIREFCQKIAKSLATGINGIVNEDTDLGSIIGETIAELINIGIGTLNTFFTTVDWEQVGSFIAGGLNGFVTNIDAKDLANLLNNIANAIKDVILGALNRLKDEDFKATAKSKIKEFFSELSASAWTLFIVLPVALKLGDVAVRFTLAKLGLWLAQQLGLAGSAVKTGGTVASGGGAALFDIVLPVALILAVTVIWFRMNDAINKTFEEQVDKDVQDAVNATADSLAHSNKLYEPAGVRQSMKLSQIILNWLLKDDDGSETSDAVKDAAEDIGTTIGESTNDGAVQGMINTMPTTLKIFESLIGKIKGVFGITDSSTSGTGGGTSKVTKGIGQKIVDGFLLPFSTLAEKFGKIWEGVKNAIKLPINGLITLINKVLEACQTMQNSIADAFNSLSFNVPDWVPSVGGKNLGFSINKWTAPKIPMLAQGAVIPPNHQFLAMLGDQSSGVNVEAPLTTIQEAVALVLEPYLKRIADNTEDLANKDYATYIGDREIARANARGTKQMGVALIH